MYVNFFSKLTRLLLCIHKKCREYCRISRVFRYCFALYRTNEIIPFCAINVIEYSACIYMLYASVNASYNYISTHKITLYVSLVTYYLKQMYLRVLNVVKMSSSGNVSGIISIKSIYNVMRRAELHIA